METWKEFIEEYIEEAMAFEEEYYISPIELVIDILLYLVYRD